MHLFSTAMPIKKQNWIGAPQQTHNVFGFNHFSVDVITVLKVTAAIVNWQVACGN